MVNSVAWSVEKHKLSLTGGLNFNTVVPLHKGVQPWLVKHPYVEINCSGITQCDSAGLVLLLKWEHFMRTRGRQLYFSHLPPQLQAMASMAHVAHLLPSSVSLSA